MCVQLFGCHIDVNATIIPGDVADHLLSVGILLLLAFGTITHDYIAMTDSACVCCRCLLHEPRTLASAAAFTAQTPMAELLAGRQDSEEINEALRSLRFWIDPPRIKIMTAGEPCFVEEARVRQGSRVSSVRRPNLKVRRRISGIWGVLITNSNRSTFFSFPNRSPTEAVASRFTLYWQVARSVYPPHLYLSIEWKRSLVQQRYISVGGLRHLDDRLVQDK
jgi:hypothetical protein